ncbi:MAG: DUF222 domain-containing protein, partial [Acidimicrobiales bacterium]|nr:DUF222 domain-containing protein [Acidimicrobiales bacterium]
WEHIVDDQLHDPTDPDDEPPERKRQKAERYFRMTQIPEGFDLSGSLPTADGLIVQTQWQHIYDELFEADWAEARKIHGDDTCISHLSRTVAQRRADALVEMARRASAYGADSTAARPLVTVMVHAEDLMGPIRETFNGTVLSRRDVAEWMTEADFERIIFDPAGQPVNMTSKDRFFTGLLRRAVQIRDRVCSHPTCDVDAERCQVDHIVEHCDGGETHIENGRLLCSCHNQQRPGRGKKPEDDQGDGDGDGDEPEPDDHGEDDEPDGGAEPEPEGNGDGDGIEPEAHDDGAAG